MAIEFKLPELGEGVDSANVSRILIAEGDTIEADQNVLELETEKAVADLPCPHAGEVTRIHVSEGDTIEVGQTLLTIEESDSQDGEQKSGKQKDDEQKNDKNNNHENGDRKQEEKSTSTKTADGRSKPTSKKPTSKKKDATQPPPAAGPATRRLARKLKVDLNELQPSSGDRIRPEDVARVYVEHEKAESADHEGAALPDFSKFGSVEREALGKIEQVSAQHLRRAWRLVPHVTQHGLADITDLEAARREYLETAEEAQAKITITSLAVKSIVGLLEEFPQFNASLDSQSNELILKQYYHIGVAVDTERGLVVPVIRDADRKSVQQIADELVELAKRARNRDLRHEDLEGGTFTISNQGGIGGGQFTPIVNYPEVAILGLARARQELKMSDGQVKERLMLPLSLSYDHRVINGADAARLIARLEEVLSDAFTLLVAA